MAQVCGLRMGRMAVAARPELLAVARASVLVPRSSVLSVEVILARNKAKGPVGNYGPQEGMTWNIHEWDVTD